MRSAMPARLLVLSAVAAVASGANDSSAVFGGKPMERAFEVWLSNWRNFYAHGKIDQVPHLEDEELPESMKGKPPKVVHAEGGAASGIVTEGMGYALMVEGMMASQGDKWALNLGLGLARAWMGMVQGDGDDMDKPLGGADKADGSASKVDVRPYGVSAIPGVGPAGVATWKFPRKLCYPLGNNANHSCHGSATDGDEDAVMGMVYLAAALEFPDDFVDLVVRNVIAFASADLGFPDLYRTLPDGTRIYVPKAGSQWGGLTPPGGKFKREAGVPDWCYAPAYFAPANYRTFRDFVKAHWKPSFDKYLPTHLDGKTTSMQDLVNSLDSAVTAGYNILYYSSCESGSVSNWVGVEAACADDENALSCEGVPWKHTPYVGAEKGNCSASGTGWGSYGADASRMPWRVAMDYALFAEESEKLRVFDRTGHQDKSIKFNARYYMNRFVTQYKRFGKCDGGKVGGCDCDYGGCRENATQAFLLSAAFEIHSSNKVKAAPTVRAPGITCDNVPHIGQSWWAGFMSWPTFTAFIAPYEEEVEIGHGKVIKPMHRNESRTWLQSLAYLCDFRNFSAEGHYMVGGAVCQKTYFHASQEIITSMIMSGNVPPLPKKTGLEDASVIVKNEALRGIFHVQLQGAGIAGAVPVVLVSLLLAFAGASRWRSLRSTRVSHRPLMGDASCAEDDA